MESSSLTSEAGEAALDLSKDAAGEDKKKRKKKLVSSTSPATDQDMRTHEEATETDRIAMEAARESQRMTRILMERQRIDALLLNGKITEAVAAQMKEDALKDSPAVLTGKDAIASRKGQITTTIDIDKLNPSDVEDVGTQPEKDNITKISVK